MYATTIQLPTFYHHYSNQFYPAAYEAQPRVGNYAGSRMLLPRSTTAYSFRLSGIILGSLILFFSIFLLSTELGRLYTGSATSSSNLTNIEIYWLWPWSSATLLFSLVFISAGVFGIISGQKESYSTILTFFICSLLSIFLLVFIIALYSISIQNGRFATNYTNLDRNLSIVCVAISCILFIILIISMILSGLSISLCTRKDFLEGEADSDNAASSYKSPANQ